MSLFPPAPHRRYLDKKSKVETKKEDTDFLAADFYGHSSIPCNHHSSPHGKFLHSIYFCLCLYIAHRAFRHILKYDRQQYAGLNEGIDTFQQQVDDVIAAGTTDAVMTPAQAGNADQ
jgi:hypothetical protein